MAQRLKHLPAVQETWVQSLSQEDPLEKEMATHSSILAWRIPWREEPSRLQSMDSQRVRHDWATSLYLGISWTGNHTIMAQQEGGKQRLKVPAASHQVMSWLREVRMGSRVGSPWEQVQSWHLWSSKDWSLFHQLSYIKSLQRLQVSLTLKGTVKDWT